ncbi:MAG: putative bifunctional diguanylate cyclase/phosphodiesterase [Halioglobus sp.]
MNTVSQEHNEYQLFVNGRLESLDLQLGIDSVSLLFPFFFVFDRRLRISKTGPSLCKLDSKLVEGADLRSFFTVKKPNIALSYNDLVAHQSSLHNWTLNDKVTIRGQLIALENDHILFAGAPWLTSSSQLNELGLTASHFARHDASLEHMFLHQAQRSSMADSRRMVAYLEQSEQERKKLEALQTALGFELDIANDFKARFNNHGKIIDLQASKFFPDRIDVKNNIGKNIYSALPFLQEPLEKAMPAVEGNGQPLKFNFSENTGKQRRYFDACLAKTPDGLYLLLARDVSQEYRLKLQLEKRANFDSLTGLPNRSFFAEQVFSRMATVHESSQLVSLMVVDLDFFKDINDSNGHAAGDFTLKIVANILSQHTRKDDLVARLGGDEFALLTVGADEPEALHALAQRICEAINKPIPYEATILRIGCSIGLTFSDSSDASLDQLQQQADLAMYQAKAAGRGTVTVYQAGMYESYREKISMRDSLVLAIESDQLSMAYQPIVAIDSGAVVGFEALARWQHPHRGNIPPDQFVAIAEDAGLMPQLGNTLLRKALRTWSQYKRHSKNAENKTLSMNISAYQLHDLSLIQTLDAALEESGITTSDIVLEITETALIRDFSSTISVVKDLKSKGFKMALDDFGTGYSSLSYLDKLPVDTLKIDRSFVSGITSRSAKAPLIEAIVTLAKVMKLDIVAEGIETETQRDVLREMNCEFAQGYLFCEPLTEQQFLNS